MTCACGCGEKVLTAGCSTVRGHHWRVKRPELWRVTETGCWEWLRYRNPNGYAQVRIGGRLWLAYQWLYLTIRGRVPKGLELDHLCRNRACVNPAHLEPVTRKTNARRGAKAKLTEATAAEVFRRAWDGEDQGELAREFGIARSTVSSVKTGRTWA